jgi:DNA topoisomerase IB
VRRDLGLSGLPRDKVLATVVRLLDTTYMRIGNDEYARENGSYGLTTLRCRHATVRGSRLKFNFRGKSGIRHKVEVEDPTLARVVQRCQALPGQDLFQYVDDDGEPRRVGSSDVNAYLREATGGDFTAKDFRTWAGTLLAYRALRALQPQDQGSPAKKNVVEAMKMTAEPLIVAWRSRRVVSPNDLLSLAYSSFPTRINVSSSSRTTAPRTFSRGSPRFARSRSARRRILGSALAKAISRAKFSAPRRSRHRG